MGRMLKCPHCGAEAIPLSRKLRLQWGMIYLCPACETPVGISYLSNMLAILPMFVLFVVSIANGWHILVTFSLLALGYGINVLIRWLWVPLRVEKD